LYDPVFSEKWEGRLLYRKRDDADKWIEHFGGKWEVKAASNRGSDNCWAWIEGGCALEACGSRDWNVYDKSWIQQKSVCLTYGSEAIRLFEAVAAAKQVCEFSTFTQ
jgi:hypothetical protein